MADTAGLAEIRRHPVKGLGAEALSAADLTPGTGLAFDRRWAVAHGASAFDPQAPAWVKRSNFVVVAMVPRLAQASAAYDETTGRLALSHPEAETVALDPDAEPERLSAWVGSLGQGGRPGPYRLARLPGAALFDTPEDHLSLMFAGSLAALGQRAGRPLERHRFRGNLWIEGTAPWEEFEWIGREVGIGEAVLRITQPIARCAAPAASPATGTRDVDVLGLLETAYDHTDFGIAAQVVQGGRIAPGDGLRLL